MRIVFMGTPEIAVSSLDALRRDGHEIAGVVTAPDRPTGRGRQLKSSAVKTYTLKHGMQVLQPENLKDPGFLARLQSMNPDLIVVVAFRMRPEEVWGMPPLGTINLHASLLPQYRGAAPINRVIMNGETKTGVSTFFIERDIDTGKIILREPVPISPDDNAGSLHDRIMKTGAELLVRTVRIIEEGNPPRIDQSELIEPGEELKTAPKIFRDDCRIRWNRPVQEVYDYIRGLSPVPAAWTILVPPDGQERILKVYAAEKMERESIFRPSTLLTDGRSRFEVVCRDGMLNLTEVQLDGRKRMGIEEFMRGMEDLSSFSIRDDNE
jgi:methionyl-tRNA formyltransferase